MTPNCESTEPMFLFLPPKMTEGQIATCPRCKGRLRVTKVPSMLNQPHQAIHDDALDRDYQFEFSR